MTSSMEPIRVVVVDDDESHRALLVGELADAPTDGPRFEVVGEAGDGAAGFSLVLKTTPDVVVMDIEMPYMDGIEATAELRGRVPDIPVVILSSHSESASLRKALAAGARDYLVKGAEAGQLLATLAEAVELARRRREAFRSKPSGTPGTGIWSFLRASGGSGQTTLLLAFANELAAAGKRVLALDLNLPFSHFSTYLKLESEEGDYAPYLAGTASSLTEVVHHHPSGILVLRPPSKATRALGIDRRRLAGFALEVLEIADYVLVDHPAGIPDSFLEVIDQSRYVFPVGHDGMTGLMGLRTLRELLPLVGVAGDRLRPAISGPSPTARRINKAMGDLHGLDMDVVKVFPYDPEAFQVALTTGQPITRVAPHSPFTRMVRDFLIPILGGAPDPPTRTEELGDLMTRLLKDL